MTRFALALIALFFSAVCAAQFTPVPPGVRAICKTAVAVPLTGTTVQTVLYTCAIPPLKKHQQVRMTWAASVGVNTNTTVFRAAYGATFATSREIAVFTFLGVASVKVPQTVNMISQMAASENSFFPTLPYTITFSLNQYAQNPFPPGVFSGAGYFETFTVNYALPRNIYFACTLPNAADTCALERVTVELLT